MLQFGTHRNPLSWPIAIILLASVLSLPAHANDFTGAGDLRWFLDANWSDGHIPTLAEDAAIVGFDVHAYLGEGDTLRCSNLEIAYYYGPGNASLYSELPIKAHFLGVGCSRTQAGHHVGVLTVNGADVIMDSDVDIATSSHEVDDSAEGHVTITDGSLYLDGSIELAYVFQDGGDANGSLSVINGDIVGSNSDGLYIAYHRSSSFASGILQLENGLLDGFTELYIGSRTSVSGACSGTMMLINSEAYIEQDVYFDEYNNGGSSLLTLDNAYFEAGYIEFGSGSTTQFHVDGLERVSPDNVDGPNQYSAIDLSDIYGDSYGAEINAGAKLEVHFGYIPSVGDSFDLIKLKPGQDFNGGTFNDVVFIDLDPALDANYEIVPGDTENGEIVRVSVFEDTSPVADLPGTGMLTIHSVTPNPFNPSMELSFEIQESTVMTMDIYDVSGKLIKTQDLGSLGYGLHRARWNGLDNNGMDVSSGVYFVRLRGTDGESQVVKAVLAR